MNNIQKIEEAMEWNMGESFMEYLCRLNFIDKLLNPDPLEIDELSESERQDYLRSVGVR